MRRQGKDVEIRIDIRDISAPAKETRPPTQAKVDREALERWSLLTIPRDDERDRAVAGNDGGGSQEQIHTLDGHEASDYAHEPLAGTDTQFRAEPTANQIAEWRKIEAERNLNDPLLVTDPQPQQLRAL